jgi:hypothetical protein
VFESPRGHQPYQIGEALADNGWRGHFGPNVATGDEGAWPTAGGAGLLRGEPLGLLTVLKAPQLTASPDGSVIEALTQSQ